MQFQPITANALRSTLDYAERVCTSRDFHLFHGIEDRRVDFRMVAGTLVDLGAPIADWRFDPRVLDVRLPDGFPVYYVGNERRYGGEVAERLGAVREEYRRRLTDWLFADKPPVPTKSDEFLVGAWLIQHMPTVEDLIDQAHPWGEAA